MAEIKVPYSKQLMEITVPDANLLGVLESKAHSYKTDKTQEELVGYALDHCIGSSPIEELVKGKKNMVIITSDHTRPVPSKITLPIVLRRIRKSNPDIDITILISTGFHRPTSKEEMADKFGRDIVNNEKIVNHVSTDEENMVQIGILPSGGELKINKIAVETELLIAEGFIEPHLFAGFSGGRKSVLPGICSAETIAANHCSEFLHQPTSRTGVLAGNKVHEDMLYAAEKAKLAFILNVVIDSSKKIINAFAGDAKLAHEQGCKFVEELSGVQKKEADIAITTNGGYPLDQNIYQAVKGMTAGEATCKKGGVIIMISACNEGTGGEGIYKTLKEAQSPEELYNRILQIPRNRTMHDQWQSQILARILMNHTVIMVTDQCDPQIIKDMKMEHAYTFEEALQRAFELKGKDASITVIPDGIAVVVK